MGTPRLFQKDSIFEPKHVTHEVGGHELQFYPLSTKMLWRMRRLAEPLADAFRVMASSRSDFERTVDQGFDPETGETRTLTHMGAVTPEIAKLREEAWKKAFERAMEALFEEEARHFVGEVLADSLRKEFSREEARDAAIVRELMDRLDTVTMGGMLHGVVKANMSVFGPFQKEIREALRSKLGDLVGTETRSPSEYDASESDESDSPASQGSSQEEPARASA